MHPHLCYAVFCLLLGSPMSVSNHMVTCGGLFFLMLLMWSLINVQIVTRLHSYLTPFVLSTQVNYFPSRFDPVRHAEKYPIPSAPIGGRREKAIIVKENNFQQPGARFRAWDPARQDRFIGRLAGMLADPRVTQVRSHLWWSSMQPYTTASRSADFTSLQCTRPDPVCSADMGVMHGLHGTLAWLAEWRADAL